LRGLGQPITEPAKRPIAHLVSLTGHDSQGDYRDLSVTLSVPGAELVIMFKALKVSYSEVL